LLRRLPEPRPQARAQLLCADLRARDQGRGRLDAHARRGSAPADLPHRAAAGDVAAPAPELQPGGAPAEFALSPFEWLGNAAIGPLPGWLVAAVVAAFYGWVFQATF